MQHPNICDAILSHMCEAQMIDVALLREGDVLEITANSTYVVGPMGIGAMVIANASLDWTGGEDAAEE